MAAGKLSVLKQWMALTFVQSLQSLQSTFRRVVFLLHVLAHARLSSSLSTQLPCSCSMLSVPGRPNCQMSHPLAMPCAQAPTYTGICTAASQPHAWAAPIMPSSPLRLPSPLVPPPAAFPECSQPCLAILLPCSPMPSVSQSMQSPGSEC